MRYRITESFTDAHGMNWAIGDKFRAHEDDDPDIYFKKGLLEDADKPAGNNLVTPQQKERDKQRKEDEARAEAAEKARAEGTGSETHAKVSAEKSGESEHKGGKSR